MRVMDLDKEPLQTKTQLAKLTGKMVPPYVYINGKYWGALGEMETLGASGDLANVVANRLDDLGDEARRIGNIQEAYDDDITVENGISLWCVSDNLRKGAALNAVQIAELLGREVLKKG